MARFWLSRFFGSSSGAAPAPPAVPTFNVADNGNGTGGVVTIAGASAGSTNTFYAAPWSGGMPGATFASYGSRTGNGTLAISPANGYFWGYVRSDLGGQIADSLVAGFRITSGLDPAFYQILLAVKAKIEALALSGVSVGNVVVQKLPIDHESVSKPCVFVCPSQERQNPASGTNSRDDVGYGVLVAAVQKSNKDLTANHARLLLWREQINRGFRNQRLPGLESTVYRVVVEPQAPVLTEAFARQYDQTAVLLRCYSREPRGVV